MLVQILHCVNSLFAGSFRVSLFINLGVDRIRGHGGGEPLPLL